MKKAPIVPVTCYVNGKQITAHSINVVSVADNLFDCATFKYTFFDANGSWAGEASVMLSGDECYKQWDASAEQAYEIVAERIGVELHPTIGKSIFEA